MKLPDFFGIDIGNHSIKLAEIKWNGKKAVLERLGGSTTSLSFVDTEDSVGLEQIANTIREIKSSAGIKTNKAVAALPETSIFSRVLEIPRTDEAKLEETIYWEAKQYIPISVDEVQLDWLQIDDPAEKNSPMTKVLLVAAPKKIVEKYQNIMKMAGIELLALETEAVSTSRVISYNQHFEKPVLVVDFGAKGTDMSVIKGKNLIFAQSIGTGSDSLTKAIMNDYGISNEQAEQYKKSYGLITGQGDDKIANSLSPVMEVIMNEVNKTINYFKAHLNEPAPQHIFIAGDGAMLPGLAEFMSQKLGIPTKIFDPMKVLDVPRGAKKSVEKISTTGYTVAVGLGMKTE